MDNPSDFQPLVSIIIPVYNGGNFMREAIESALSQTYSNIEVIVVNDGSNDGGETDRICKSYGERIRYFAKKNGGCASALNLGIEKMQGDYFSWLSHDDKYRPNKIKRQVEVLYSLRNKNTIIFSGYELIDSKSVTTGTVRPDRVLTPAQLSVPLLPLVRGLIHGCSLLIPREYFDVVGVFDSSLPSTQDYALWFDLFRIAPLHFDSEINVQSRVHPDQGTHKIEKHIDECNALWSGFLDRLTREEMTAMGGTEYNFLMQQADFLKKTPYKEAAELAIKMAEEARQRIVISVIIPFFNRTDWTIAAIQSVLLQTYQNFEIILVDDGSTDDVSDLMKLIETDKRIVYLSQSNAGPASARNLGVERAVGDYLSFLDSDDLFLPRKLETQLNYMLDNDLVFSHTSYQRIDLEGKPIEDIHSAKSHGNVFPGIISTCTIATPTVMVRTDVMRRYKFRESARIGEDVCLWIDLSRDVQLGSLDRVLTKVRIGSATAALDPQKQAAGCINIAHYVINDPYLSRFSEEISKLLQSAIWQVQAGNGTQGAATVSNTASLGANGTERGLLFLRRGVSYLRTHGFRATVRRAFRLLRSL